MRQSDNFSLINVIYNKSEVEKTTRKINPAIFDRFHCQKYLVEKQKHFVDVDIRQLYE